MTTSRIDTFAPKQVIVMDEAKNLVGLDLPQSESEKKISGSNYKVATLSDDRIAQLRAQGYKVFDNHKVGVPTPPEPPQEVPLNMVASDLKVSVPTHGADKLHEKGIKGQGATVVVIDTGIEAHPDIAARIRKHYDVFTRSEGEPSDGHGHGTHVAGIVGAAGGVVGMAPETDFIGIKVLDDRGSGSWASVMAGIDKAMDYYRQGFRPMVVNMSLGGGAGKVESDPVVAKVREAMALGIEFVIAAGNSGPRSNTVGSPGTTPEAITVAAVDTKQTVTQDDDIIAYFSSRGGDNEANGQVGKPDIAANGVKVLSLGKNGGYARMSGTSMASPTVAGAVALLMSYAKKLEDEGRLTVKVSDIDYAELLYKTANDRPSVPEADEGAGILRVDLAAEALEQRYTEPSRLAFDRERKLRYDHSKRRWVVDREATMTANQLRSRELARKAGTLDKFEAARGKGAPRRFLAFLQDVVEAPFLAAAAAKDYADAKAQEGVLRSR